MKIGKLDCTRRYDVFCHHSRPDPIAPDLRTAEHPGQVSAFAAEWGGAAAEGIGKFGAGPGPRGGVCLVVCATLEEAGRWTAQLEAMGWRSVQFYPTSETSPYESFDSEAEMTWGQLQVLADLSQVDSEDQGPDCEDDPSDSNLKTRS